MYDQFYGERGAMGVMGSAAFQLVDDPNDVTVWHDDQYPEGFADHVNALLNH